MPRTLTTLLAMSVSVLAALRWQAVRLIRWPFRGTSNVADPGGGSRRPRVQWPSAARASAVLLGILAIVLVSRADGTSAWKPYTHEFASDAALQDALDGSVDIEPLGSFPVAADAVNALTKFPDFYRGGVIGPDAFPDIVFGQSIIHVTTQVTADRWLQHIWSSAQDWPPATESPYKEMTAAQRADERLKAVAFAYGFLTHAAGDMFGHTFVNRWSGGVFPDLLGGGNAAEKLIALKHIVVEDYVNSKLARKPLEIDAPIDFIFQTLVDNSDARTFSGDSHPFFPIFLDLRQNLADNPNVWGTAIAIATLGQGDVARWTGYINDGLEAYLKVSIPVGQAAIDKSFAETLSVIKAEYDEWANKHLCRMISGLDFDCDDLAGVFAVLDNIFAAFDFIPFVPDAVKEMVADVRKFITALGNDAAEFVLNETLKAVFGLSIEELKDKLAEVKEDAILNIFPGVDVEIGEDPTKDFAPLYNTTVLAKLILLDRAGLGQVFDSAGVARPASLPENIMLGVVRSMDGDYQWREDSPHAIADPGFVFWKAEGAREAIFYVIFHCGDISIPVVPQGPGDYESDPSEKHHLVPSGSTVETLEQAVSEAGDGDFVLVDSGSTFEDVSLEVSKGIVLHGKLANGEPTVELLGSDLEEKRPDAIVKVNSEMVATLSGLRVRKGRTGILVERDGKAHICLADVNSNTVFGICVRGEAVITNGTEVTGNGLGIFVTGRAAVMDTTVKESDRDGIFVGGSAELVTRHSTIQGNGVDCSDGKCGGVLGDVEAQLTVGIGSELAGNTAWDLAVTKTVCNFDEDRFTGSVVVDDSATVGAKCGDPYNAPGESSDPPDWHYLFVRTSVEDATAWIDGERQKALHIPDPTTLLLALKEEDLDDSDTLSIRRPGEDVQDSPFFNLRLELSKMLEGRIPGVVFDGCICEMTPTDFGDLLSYPTLLEQNGAHHLNSNFEWLGRKFGSTGTATSADSVSPEPDAAPATAANAPDATVDPDGVTNMSKAGETPPSDDLDRFDNGVVYFPLTYQPNATGVVEFTVCVDERQAGRYRAAGANAADADHSLFVNGWIDWNTNDMWEEVNREHVVDGARIDPSKGFAVAEVRSGNAPQLKEVVGNCATFRSTFLVGTLDTGRLTSRFRLDYGEDVGRNDPRPIFVSDVSLRDPALADGVEQLVGARGLTRGAARHGEVEDYIIGSDFGDAPDTVCTTGPPAPNTYPTCKSPSGARHLNITREWLGPTDASVSREIDACDGTADQDLHPNFDSGKPPCDEEDKDELDDGVTLQPPVVVPGGKLTIHVTVGTSISYRGFTVPPPPESPQLRDVSSLDARCAVRKFPLKVTPQVSLDKGRYNGSDPLKTLYLNGWIDWNADGDWDDPGEKVLDGLPIAPETFGNDGQYTLGEPFSDANANGVRDQGEDFTDVAGVDFKLFTCEVPVPPAPPLTDKDSRFYARFRLDFGENVQTKTTVAHHSTEDNRSLVQPRGGALWGEVEDYPMSTIEIDFFPESEATVTFDTPLGTDTVTLTGPTTIEVDFATLGDVSDECPSPGGPDSANGLEEVQTEIVQLELSGTSALVGAMTIRLRDPSEHPNQQSTGQIEENINHNPVTLDIPPFIPKADPRDSACSFFDVFFEVEITSLPPFPLILHSHVPKRMEAEIYEKPPKTTYENPIAIPLFDESENATGIQITGTFHSPGGPTPTPEPSPSPIGGIAELVVDGLDAPRSADEGFGSAASVIITGVAAGLALFAGAWCARRRWIA